MFITIFNTCGISGRDNLDTYIENIQSLLSENIEQRVVVSSCLNTPESRMRLENHFGNKIGYNYFDDRYTVNVTFNKTAKVCRNHFGADNIQGYFYIDSGVCITEKDTMVALTEELSDSRVGMVSTNSTTDNGYKPWFGRELTERELVPPGKALHPHCHIFSPKILEFYGGLWPDIFGSYCTESTMSFLVAAIKLWWVARPDLMVGHVSSMDGASSGFTHEHPAVFASQHFGHGIWNHTIGKKSMRQIIADPEGYSNGFGYEEIQKILMHKPECFDENYFCKNEKLKEFLKNNIFLSKDELDYDAIRCRFVP